MVKVLNICYNESIILISEVDDDSNVFGCIGDSIIPAFFYTGTADNISDKNI